MMMTETDAGLALLLPTVWKVKTKDVAGREVAETEAVSLAVFVDGYSAGIAGLGRLCWSWLVLTSVLSVKAVAVRMTSVGITIQLN